MKNLDAIIPYGEVLYPTEEEFKDFRAYVNKLALSPKYATSSCIKVCLQGRATKKFQTI